MLLVRLQSAGLENYIFQLGQIVVLLRRRERDRRVQAGDADDGTIEVIEGFFVDDGGNLAREPSRARVLVQDDDLVRFLHCLRDRFAIQRGEGAKVKNLYIDSFLVQDFGRFQRDRKSVV